MSQPTPEKPLFPVLHRIEKTREGDDKIIERIKINNSPFTIGRNEQASLPIINIAISRQHCIIKNVENNWYIIDQSKFGTRLNKTVLRKENEALLQDGDVIGLDGASEFVYKICFPPQPCSSPAPKRMKLEAHSSRLSMSQEYQDQYSAMQSKLNAAKLEQSQFEKDKMNLNNSYQQKIDELEKKFLLEKEKMENQANDDEAQQKVLAKERRDMEIRLQAEKDEIKEQYEKENESLHSKVEEQKLAEEKLKEENEKLQSMIEAERREFEQKLANERLQLEQEANRKAEEEKAKLEKELTERFENFKEQQELEKNRFNEELEKGTLDKQKLEEQHQKVMEQLKEKEEAAAQQLNEKQLLEKQLQEMEQALKEKEEQKQLLSEELTKKEEEKKQELERLRAQQEAENQRIREDLKTQEEHMRLSLDSEITKLESDKQKLEADIRKEMNAESIESKLKYETELEKVKKQLGLMESKKQVLEQELASNYQEKEKITENCLMVKQKVLEDFGEMMQSELQCQICSELFVIATTLNCTHTFCKHCIMEWKRKKTKAVADCPVCRAPIVSENRSIVLDNFIDKMVESLTDELKEQRKQLLIERGARPGPTLAVPSTSNAPNQIRVQQVPAQNVAAAQRNHQFVVLNHTLNAAIQQAQQTNNAVTVNLPPGHGIPIRGAPRILGGPRQRGGRSNAGGGNGARRQGQRPAPAPNQVRMLAPNAVRVPQAPTVPTVIVPAPPRQAAPAQQQPRPADVQILNQSNRQTNSPPIYAASGSDSDDSDEIIVPGLNSNNYGGFGRCFSCGMKGHWAPGCPFGSRR